MFESTNAAWSLPPRLRGLVEYELADGEELIWAAQPDPRRFALKSLPIVLFGIPWTAFILFWIAGASGFKIPDFSEGSDFFPLFAIPFLLIGLGMLSAPFWMMRKARRTAYVITERRAIIFEGGWSMKIRSFGPEDLQDLRRRQRRDGSGDVVFAQEVSYSSKGHRQSTDIGFFAIPDVKEVEDLLEEIVKQHRGE